VTVHYIIKNNTGYGNRFASLGDVYLIKERFRNSAERLSGHAQWRPVSAQHHTEGLQSSSTSPSAGVNTGRLICTEDLVGHTLPSAAHASTVLCRIQHFRKVICKVARRISAMPLSFWWRRIPRISLCTVNAGIFRSPGILPEMQVIHSSGMVVLMGLYHAESPKAGLLGPIGPLPCSRKMGFCVPTILQKCSTWNQRKVLHQDSY